MQKIGIFASSKSTVFETVVKQLFIILSNYPVHIVYGGGKKGLMGVVYTESKYNNIPITGHNLAKWFNPELNDIIYHTLVERQNGIVNDSNIFLVLPGGIGTVYEMVQILCHNDVNEISKPIIVFNIDGFYTTFIAFIEEMRRSHFIESSMNLIVVSNLTEFENVLKDYVTIKSKL
jgi:uncharacterized protein (TIGR00730 family)